MLREVLPRNIKAAHERKRSLRKRHKGKDVEWRREISKAGDRNCAVRRIAADWKLGEVGEGVCDGHSGGEEQLQHNDMFAESAYGILRD